MFYFHWISGLWSRATCKYSKTCEYLIQVWVKDLASYSCIVTLQKHRGGKFKPFCFGVTYAYEYHYAVNIEKVSYNKDKKLTLLSYNKDKKLVWGKRFISTAFLKDSSWL